MELTNGFLQGGRIAYAQPRDGYRTGIEPVLLAASIPARPGDRVLEAGTGAGAGLLCLLARVPGLVATGIEIDLAMADLARRNLPADVSIVAGNILTAAVEPVDHAFANPPWHDPRSTASPLARRRLAKHGRAADWIPPLARILRPGGTLTLIAPPASLGDLQAAAVASGLPSITVLRLPPKDGRVAKLILMRALAGAAALVELPPVVLHEASGQFTPTVERVLRESATLPLSNL